MDAPAHPGIEAVCDPRDRRYVSEGLMFWSLVHTSMYLQQGVVQRPES